MINDFMSNRQEFFNDEETITFLKDEVKLDPQAAKTIFSHRAKFAINPLYELRIQEGEII